MARSRLPGSLASTFAHAVGLGIRSTRAGKRRPARRGKGGSTSRRRQKKRRSGGGKLKFGSPAWRAKYMKGGKRKKRRKK